MKNIKTGVRAGAVAAIDPIGATDSQASADTDSANGNAVAAIDPIG